MSDEDLFHEIGPQKVEDIKTAYRKGWISFEEFEEYLDEWFK